MRVRGRCVDVLTNGKNLDNARSCSVILEVSENGHVVIGVPIVQCYHAIMDNSEHVVIGVRTVQCYKRNHVQFRLYPLLVQISNHFPISTCFWGVSSLFPVANFCTLLHRENMSFEVLCLHHPSVTVDRRQQ